MKLISLELENFRQHADSKIIFDDGITLISGSNGSGKSTILEAISWTIYGTEAARGNKTSIKWNKAPARSKVRAELIFEFDNERYRVNRELNKAEVYLNDNEAPVAITQDEVTKYLTERLGMSRMEFFNTYFTGQKELGFLSNKGATERKNFISKVLSYEKVRNSQEKIRTAKNNLSNEILGIKQGLGNVEALEEEKKQAQENLKQIKNLITQQKENFSELSLQKSELEPAWEKIKTDKDAHDKIGFELNSLNEKAEIYKKNIENQQKQLEILELKQKELQELSSVELEYKKLEVKIIELEKLQEKESEKQKLLARQKDLENELPEKQALLEEIIVLGKEKKAIIDKIPTLKEEITLINKSLREEEQGWLSEKREKEVLVNQKKLEIDKYKKQLAIIEEKGEDGTCPTCERALKAEFKKVTDHFKNNIALINSEITLLVEQIKLLNVEPSSITKNRALKEQKEKEFEDLNKFEGQYLEERNRYKLIKSEIDLKTKELEEIKSKLTQYSCDFDIEELKKYREAIIPVRKNYEKIQILKAETAGIDGIKSDFEKNKALLDEILKTGIDLDKKLSELNYSQDEYLKTRAEYELFKEKFYKAKEELVKAETEKKSVEELILRIQKQEEAYNEKLELIKTKQDDLNHLTELDKFYGGFLDKLNNMARPEISELASGFLSNLTDGRYTELELNDKYEINLLDDGEVKPVISGGEEDIANLCVRLALSQMIAQRSGKSLTLLVLDEVFGSLDESRRNNVMSLLQGLTNDFEQVIIITHIDEIKEGLDNIIYVEYDEQKGCSKIKHSLHSEFDYELLGQVQDEDLVLIET